MPELSKVSPKFQNVPSLIFPDLTPKGFHIPAQGDHPGQITDNTEFSLKGIHISPIFM